MNELKFTVIIDTENEFGIEDIYETIMTLKARLEGYHTDMPDKMSDNTEMCFDINYSINNVNFNLRDEVEKFYKNNNTLPSSNG